MGTPRRLVLHIMALAPRQEPMETTVRGPSRQVAYDADGNPSRQAVGFAQSQGVEVSDLRIQKVKGGEYVFALRRQEGEDTATLLPRLFSELIVKLPVSRPMRWGEGEFRFIRPIRWLLALYGDEPIPFSMAGINARPLTYGHRTMNPGPHPVADTRAYLSQLPEWGVILSPRRRQEIIQDEVTALAQKAGGQALLNEDLLAEVVGLVEFPTAFLGRFDERFLTLPADVLVTTLRHHQRVFPIGDAQRRLLPLFVGVRNGDHRHLETVVHGNERVIAARLADAEFFFEQDSKGTLDERLDELKRVVFLEGSGTLYEKTERVTALARTFALLSGLRDAVLNTVSRAAWLSKADLVTHLVREFPELQGIMGKEYALLDGEPKEVAQAIYEHYKPRTTDDDMPNSMAGVMVGLSDRLDTLACCFARGMQPSGSQDPYGLRRQAQGVVQLLWHAELPLDVKDIITRAVEPMAGHKGGQEDVVKNLMEFIQLRARTLFADAGMAVEVIDAVFADGLREVVDSWRRCRALAEFARHDEFLQLMTAYKRVANLATKQEGETGVAPEYLRDEAEKDLFAAVQKAQEQRVKALDKRDYTGYLRILLALKPSIDRFFDEVMVLVEDTRLRDNRLGLLAQTQTLFQGMARFDRLQVTVSRKVSKQ